MEYQAIQILENKIDQLLTQLNELKENNRQLKATNAELMNRLQEKERFIQSTKEDADRVQTMKQEINNYRENQDKIRLKVEGLIDKLKEFDAIH